MYFNHLAPMVLKAANLAHGKQITSYPGIRDDLKGKLYCYCFYTFYGNLKYKYKNYE